MMFSTTRERTGSVAARVPINVSVLVFSERCERSTLEKLPYAIFFRQPVTPAARCSFMFGTLTIFVHNYGRRTHDLVIAQDGQTTGQTEPLPPGQGAVIALDLAPGTYSMASTILTDQALGAYGTLKVSQ